MFPPNSPILLSQHHSLTNDLGCLLHHLWGLRGRLDCSGLTFLSYTSSGIFNHHCLEMGSNAWKSKCRHRGRKVVLTVFAWSPNGFWGHFFVTLQINWVALDWGTNVTCHGCMSMQHAMAIWACNMLWLYEHAPGPQQTYSNMLVMSSWCLIV